MPTVADLERLKGLTDRLGPIATVAQGELIRADNWNTLVGSVIEIARAVLTSESDTTVPPHEHPDQVTVGWLDPQLRALIERGPLSDPAAMTRLGNLEQKVDRLSARVEELAGQLNDTRDRVTDVTTHDLTRQNDITNVRRSIEGLSDSRTSVLELRESLRSLQTDVTTAVTIGQSFIVDGQPVDVQALVNRVKNVETLRDNLTGPDGQVFDAKGFENRLTQLTNTLVTQDQLDSALHNVKATITPEDLAGIEGNLRTSLTNQLTATMTGLGNDIRGETNSKLAEIDGLVGTAVSNSQPTITTSVLNTIRPEISAAVAAGKADSQTLFEKELNDSNTALAADFSAKIGDVQLGVNASVAAQFANQLPAAIAPIQSQVDGLAKQVEPMNSRLGAVETSLSKVSTRVEEVNVQSNNNLNGLRSDMLKEMDRRDQVKTTDLNTRFSQYDSTVNVRIGNAIQDNNRVILDQTKIIATDVATTQVTLATNQLRTEIPTISRNSVADVVHAEVSAIQPTLTRNVATELKITRGTP